VKSPTCRCVTSGCTLQQLQDLTPVRILFSCKCDVVVASVIGNSLHTSCVIGGYTLGQL